MNAKRKEAIKKLADQLDNLHSELEIIRDEEQDYYDNVPENLQWGERYEAVEQTVENLTSAVDSLSDVCEQLIEIVEN